MLMNLKRILLLWFSLWALTACSNYAVDTSRNASLASSMKSAANNRQETRKTRPHETQAPAYIDYSKSNPVLRHDDEYDASKKYEVVDPFEEKTEFYDYQRMKQKQQSQRRSNQDGTPEKEEKAPLSLW